MSTNPDGSVDSSAVAVPPTHVVSLAPVSALRIAAGVFIAFFVVALARNLPDTFTRVMLGFVFALALDPVVVRLQVKMKVKRGTAVALVGILAAVFFALLVIIVSPRAVKQAESFSRDLPQTIDNLAAIPVIGQLLEEVEARERIREWVNELPTRFSDRSIPDLISSLIGGVVAGVTVLVVGIATLADGESLVRRMRRLVPGSQRERAVQVGRIFYRTIGAYFAGSLLVASLAATFVLTVGLLLGVPLAPVAAVWVLIVNFIPQIGGFLAASVFTLLAFGQGPGTALLCLVLYVLYMNIENHVLQPLIVGNAVNLSAATTMLAALIGASAAGVPGAIIATPLVGTVKALYMELRYGPLPAAERRPGVFERLFRWIGRLFRR